MNGFYILIWVLGGVALLVILWLFLEHHLKVRSRKFYFLSGIAQLNADEVKMFIKINIYLSSIGEQNLRVESHLNTATRLRLEHIFTIKNTDNTFEKIQSTLKTFRFANAREYFGKIPLDSSEIANWEIEDNNWKYVGISIIEKRYCIIFGK